MTVGSLFSGIGAFDLGFERAGFSVRWQVEKEPYCLRVLDRRWPALVRRVTDINAVAYGRAKNRRRHGLMLAPVDVIIGGFPCQDVSVAGKRAGLTGGRSGLFFAFMRIVSIMQAETHGRYPKAVVIENVPGLISSHGGRDFHTVLAEVAERGFRRAYRILDSQYFGVPQRRRRVFIVGCHRELGISPESVLFESAGSERHSATSRSSRAHVAASLRGRSHGAGVNAPGRGGEDDVNLVATLQGGGNSGQSEPGSGLVMGALGGGAYGTGRRTEDDPNLICQCHGGNVGPLGSLRSGNGHVSGGVPFVASSGERERALTSSMHKRHDDDTDTIITATLNSGRNSGGFRTEPGEHLIAFDTTQVTSRENRSNPHAGDPCHPLSSSAQAPAIASTFKAYSGRQQIEQHYEPTRHGVRRLTPLECERLQGLPDGWTCLCGAMSTATCTCPDSPRYRACGNAVTVTVAEWIARRLHALLSKVAA